jgi:serine/threonine protein kinase
VTPEQRDRIEAIFEAALDIEPAGRAAFVAAECADDDIVRGEVEALLAAHDRDFGILEAASPSNLAASLLEAYRPGSTVGPYRLVREIGRGGMGIVFLAERADGQFRRSVAIKVMRASADPGEVQRRLEAERQILASLDHPNIARLYDGGFTPDGRPYLVMEHIEGRPIDVYCDEERLSVEERLRLFAAVIHAVHYAHRRLVVHRDLKPSNILVTEEGQPKLLDFGIAKILEESPLEEAAPETRTGLRLLTPEYASPEQVRGGLITTANDVYALGIILFELLTGRRPFDVADLTAAEAERVILWKDAPRPSTLLARLTAEEAEDWSAADAATARRSTPARLNRQLAGDIDNVVLMALRKEPERRYASAQQFAEDIERHLDGRPVLARGTSATYRARKFVDRHRWGVLAGMLIFLLLTAGIVATLTQARATARQAQIALAERERAEQEAARAASVQSFVVDMFRLSDPNEALGDTITAREMLDRGADRIEREFGDQPDVQALLLAEVARVYTNIGLLDRAESLIRQSVDLSRQVFGDSSAEASIALFRLGQILAAQGRREESVEPLRTVIAIRDRMVTKPDSLMAAAQAALGWEVRALGHHDEAADLFTSALEAERVLRGDDAPEVANAMLGLASAMHDGGRFDEAEALFGRALENRDVGLDQPHPMAALALLNVGMIRRIREQYIDAAPMLETALRMRRSLYGAEHPLSLEAASEYAIVLENLGRYEEAASLQESSLAVSRRVLGEAHPRTSSLHASLSWTLTRLGQYESALEHSAAAISLRRQQYGGDHPQIEYDLMNSADAVIALGRLDDAEARLGQAESMARRMSDTPGVFTMLILRRRADVALDRDRPEEADSLLRLATAIGNEALRPDHRYNLATHRTLARLRIRQGRPADAIALLESVGTAEDVNLPSPHPLRAATLRLLGEAQLLSGDPALAEATLRASLDELAGLPPTHWLAGETQSLIGAAVRAQGREEEAVRLLNDGLRIIRDHVGANTPATRRAEARTRTP